MSPRNDHCLLNNDRGNDKWCEDKIARSETDPGKYNCLTFDAFKSFVPWNNINYLYNT